MMWGYDGAWSWGGMAMMTLSILFWVALLGAILFVVVRWLGHPAAHAAVPVLSARQILEQRYARGEIDEETFHRMRDHLKPLPPLAK